MIDLFWLYRPVAPSLRAQSIQVVHAAHAMAARGHRVALCVQRPGPEPVAPRDVLRFYDLAPAPSLRLRVLTHRTTVASAAYRAELASWALRTRGGGIAIARSKRHAAQALRWGLPLRLVLEAHEVDSELAREGGRDPGPMRALERRVLGGAVAVVCNAPGTLELLREVHGPLPPACALHNATSRSRCRSPSGPGRGVGYAGSLRSYKDVATVAEAAARRRAPITLVGAAGPDARALQRSGQGWLRLEPPLDYARVPDRLAAFRTLLLPLASGLFGDALTSPLKLWDYLAVGVPIVAADTAAVRRAAPGRTLGYRPGDPADLARALDRADEDEAARARVTADRLVRTWDDRAGELEAFLAEVL